MVTIRLIEKSDLPAITKEPYSVTITEPGDRLERLQILFNEHGFNSEESGAVAIDDGNLKGTLQYFRSGPCIHGLEIGYVIHDKNDWGKGIASAALQLLTDKLMKERPALHRLQLTIDCDNTGSWKVAEKCGYRREGILHNAGFGDPPPDVFVYSHTRNTP